MNVCRHCAERRPDVGRHQCDPALVEEVALAREALRADVSLAEYVDHLNHWATTVSLAHGFRCPECSAPAEHRCAEERDGAIVVVGPHMARMRRAGWLR